MREETSMAEECKVERTLGTSPSCAARKSRALERRPNPPGSPSRARWIRAACSGLALVGFVAGVARAQPATGPSAEITLSSGPSGLLASGVVFEALGLPAGMDGKDLLRLAVVSPTQLLGAATPFQADSAFDAVQHITGIARDPVDGRVFVIGNDDVSSYLGTLDLSTGVETTVGKISGEIIVDIAFDPGDHLEGLTDDRDGAHPHSILTIDKATAAAQFDGALDPDGTSGGTHYYGAIAIQPAGGTTYYADADSNSHLFIDRLGPGGFAHTRLITSTITDLPAAMTYSQGRLWISGRFTDVYSFDPANSAAGLRSEGYPLFPTPAGNESFFVTGWIPAELPCVPSPTAACLANRFKVEVTYDATPSGSSGPGNVVLESTESVKFWFFDPSNIELIVKSLDGCWLNHQWWVFAGGLTDVGVVIQVTDTSTGAVKTYTNAKGKLFQTFGDTAAFDCP